MTCPAALKDTKQVNNYDSGLKGGGRGGLIKLRQLKKHVDSLIERLVLHSALPKVFACLWCGCKVCQDDLFILHVENERTCRTI